MPISFNFYQDQVLGDGTSAAPLEPAHRLLFLRHGAAKVNGETLSTGQFTYCGDAVSFLGDTDWSEIWRWELSRPNLPHQLLQGNGVLSRPKLAQTITTLETEPDTDWVFRLDRITSAPGRVTPRHQHHGPGIRCLYQGTFNVEDQGHKILDIGPGDAWWESGMETVVAWRSLQFPAIFIRGLLLPIELEGTISNICITDDTPSQSNWDLLYEKKINL